MFVNLSMQAEYKLEITDYGRQAQQHVHHQKQQSGGWFGSWFGSQQHYQQPVRQGWLSWLFGGSQQPAQKKGWFGGTGTLAIIGLIILVVYKKLIAPAAQHAAPLRGGAHEEHWYTRYFPQANTQNSNARPPPYGFNDAGAPPPRYDDTRYKNANAAGGATASQGGSGGGFWQGRQV